MDKQNKTSSSVPGKILIIDDSIQQLMILQRTLELEQSYSVFTANSGSLGIEIAGKERPHFILTDVNLPDISGYEVCARLKENALTKDIPIAFISGDDSKDQQVKGLQLGALDYITKPIDRKILTTKARSFVQLCKEHRQVIELQNTNQKTTDELRLFSQALNNANDGVVLTTTSGAITYANTAFEQLAACPLTEIQKYSMKTFIAEDELIKKAITNALGGEPSSAETMLEGLDKSTCPILLRCSAVINDHQKPTGLLFMASDLTEQQKGRDAQERLEVELFHAQKLESVGQLAAGIAHEINTPIQFVGDNIRFMQDAMQELFALQTEQRALLESARTASFAPDLIARIDDAALEADLDYLNEEIPKAIEQSLEGVGRVSSIVKAMKEFAHPGSSEMAPSDLNDAIRTTTIVARNKWKYDAEMVLDFDEDLPPIPCLIDEFNQVILNLIVNAADAIHDHRDETGPIGRITISTKQTSSFAEVRVQDTGGGIPQNIQKKIFDPFFTTKEVGRGSGQGLAIAHGVIITKHHGEFGFETEEGTGTTFIIRLPLTQAAAATQAPEPRGEA